MVRNLTKSVKLWYINVVDKNHTIPRKPLKERTKQYMAGLFDAEGCFTINSTFRKKSNCLGFTSQIILGSTDLKTIKWVVKNFGGVYKKRKVSKKGNKTPYYWVISNRTHGLFFLSTIEPYLIIKKKQLNVLKEYYELGNSENPEKRKELRDKIKAMKWDKGSVTTETLNIPNVSNAYCAGYIDGDGSISKTGIQAEGKVITSIAALHKKFGGHFSKRELSKKNKKWSDTFVWSLHNAIKVEKILLGLIPYLIEKRSRAMETLNSIRKRMKIQSELIGDYESEPEGTLVS